MKKLFSVIFISAAFTAVSQPKKAPKMAPVTAPGYYVNAQKSDTVRGDIRSNPESELDLYAGFSFKPSKGAGKLMPITMKKAKAYGFEGRNFVLLNVDGESFYAEVLARGRLNFFERKYMGKIDGYPAIEAEYYIQDNMAEGADAELKEIKKISNKFYKKSLQPYMKEQPMIWSDFDKFTFDKAKVVAAIEEFNKFYVITPDPDKEN
jgi:hypothetical protein